MKYVGAHVSAEAGVSNTPVKAQEIGAKAFALFTRNLHDGHLSLSPRLRLNHSRPIVKSMALLGVILPHDSFLINLGSPDAEKLAKSRVAFLDELQRCEQLGLTMLNFHPGSHLNQIAVDDCLDLIADSINDALDKTKG